METPIRRKWQRTIALARGYLSDDSPKRADWQFPDPILAGFFSSASTSSECNLCRGFLSSNNAERTMPFSSFD